MGQLSENAKNLIAPCASASSYKLMVPIFLSITRSEDRDTVAVMLQLPGINLLPSLR